MEVLKRLLRVGCVLVLSSCDFVRDPVAIQIQRAEVTVHSVLQAGSDTVRVALHQTRPGAEEEARNGEPLSGATVELAGNTGRIRLAEASAGFGACLVYNPNQGINPPAGPEGRGCYTGVVGGGIRAGERYEMQITLPDGRTIHGSTVPLSAPQILQPHSGARIALKGDTTPWRQPASGAGIPVRFGASRGTAQVLATVQWVAAFKNGKELSGAPCDLIGGGAGRSAAEADTITIRFFAPAYCLAAGTNAVSRVFPDSLRVNLVVTAYDSTYVRYYSAVYTSQVVKSRDAAAGVTGGLGLFASAASAKQPVTVVLTY